MRAYDITLALIMFSLAVVIVNSSGLLGDTPLKQYDGPDFLGILKSLAPKTSESLAYSVLAISAFSLIMYAIKPLLGMLVYSTILMDFFLPLLGMPYYFTLPLTIGTWMSFIIGHAQVQANTTLRGQE